VVNECRGVIVVAVAAASTTMSGVDGGRDSRMRSRRHVDNVIVEEGKARFNNENRKMQFATITKGSGE